MGRTNWRKALERVRMNSTLRDAERRGEERERRDTLHALGAASPITVVEVEAFALEDECADAILEDCQQRLM